MHYWNEQFLKRSLTNIIGRFFVYEDFFIHSDSTFPREHNVYNRKTNICSISYLLSLISPAYYLVTPFIIYLFIFIYFVIWCEIICTWNASRNKKWKPKKPGYAKENHLWHCVTYYGNLAISDEIWGMGDNLHIVSITKL